MGRLNERNGGGGGLEAARQARRITALARAAGVAGCLLGTYRVDAAPNYSATVLYELSVPSGSKLQVSGFDPGGAAGGLVPGALQTVPPTHPSAYLWTTAGSGSVRTPINISPNPTMYYNTVGLATDGTYEVGYGAIQPTGQTQAFLWTGSNSNAVDLSASNPLNLSCFAMGVGGGEEVGWGSGTVNGGAAIPLMWIGSNNTTINLEPTNLSGYQGIIAQGTDGIHQVGFASTRVGSHAMLWSGSGSNAVDLNPANYNTSSANAVSGSQEVGSGVPSGGSNSHALMWFGSATNVVDLAPTNLPGITSSSLYATNGEEQVGFGTGSSTNASALLWTGSATNVVDLQSLLPSYLTTSWGNSIDSSGDVFGLAQDASGNFYAVEFTPTPEPTSLGLLSLSGLALLKRRSPHSRASL